MKTDPILKELWQVKDRLAAEHGHDLRRLFESLQALQRERGARVINRTRREATIPDSQT